MKQFKKLSDEYNLESISEKISFSSGGGYYGQVKYYTSGKVIDVNLGHKTDLVKNREFNISKPESNLNLPKSAVDAENINIANHATVLYNINAKNINSNETANWNEFVRVFIL